MEIETQALFPDSIQHGRMNLQIDCSQNFLMMPQHLKQSLETGGYPYCHQPRQPRASEPCRNYANHPITPDQLQTLSLQTKCKGNTFNILSVSHMHER